MNAALVPYPLSALLQLSTGKAPVLSYREGML